ncbi:MAG: OmpA family protein, partial [Candidatus Electrothrix sp. GM3_4]|nr:OmpA family protein [Candidatus Electrothrix sp. GM3_4]
TPVKQEQVALPVQQEVQVKEVEAPPVQQKAQESAILDNDNDGNVDATIILSGVNFTVGTANLTEEAAATLETTASLLEKHASGQRFEVAGYTDSMGSPRRNRQISEQRAETVRNFLIKQGIKANLLIRKGYGHENPIADNDTQEGRAMNRRVELHQITAE